ncbi:MAG: bacteriocin, partial [Thermotogota bacterium]
EKIKVFEEKARTDWFNQLGDITTTEKLIKMGTEYGITLSEVEAQEGLDLLQTNGKELSEEELSAIAGGKGAIVF